MLARIGQNQILYGPDNLMSQAKPKERDRLKIVEWARWNRVYDPLTSHAITVWTDYGFGKEVDVSSEDEVGQAVWDEFVNARRNSYVMDSREVHRQSDTLLTDGELFIICTTDTVQGYTTVRLLYTDEISNVLHVSTDRDKPVLYERKWVDKDGQAKTLYYRDWRATDEDIVNTSIPDDAQIAGKSGQEVVVLAVRFIVSGGRGWPIVSSAYPWSQAYKQFATDRAAVARAVASVIEEFEVEGGSRGVKALQAQIQSSLATGSPYETNPPAGAGSSRIQNKAVSSRRLSQETGASDAREDSMMLMGQVATGFDMPAFMLGRTDMLQNRATAEVVMRPTLRTWNRYQDCG